MMRSRPLADAGAQFLWLEMEERTISASFASPRLAPLPPVRDRDPRFVPMLDDDSP